MASRRPEAPAWERGRRGECIGSAVRRQGRQYTAQGRAGQSSPGMAPLGLLPGADCPACQTLKLSPQPHWSLTLGLLKRKKRLSPSFT
jgi:hypothetical protein